MATSTFSGPIRAGDIIDTTGNTLGTNVANVGQVVMAQSFRFTQNALNTSANTTIVIPANSQIAEITLYVDTAFTAGVTAVGIGTSASATAFTNAGAVTGLGTAGIFSVVPNTAGQTANFIDVGTTDVRITVTMASAAAGSGTGVITVRYLQNINLL